MTEQITLADPSAVGVSSERVEPAPVTAQERMFSVDALRGLAVLGIAAGALGNFVLGDRLVFRPRGLIARRGPRQDRARFAVSPALRSPSSAVSQ